MTPRRLLRPGALRPAAGGRVGGRGHRARRRTCRRSTTLLAGVTDQLRAALAAEAGRRRRRRRCGSAATASPCGVLGRPGYPEALADDPLPPAGAVRPGRLAPSRRTERWPSSAPATPPPAAWRWRPALGQDLADGRDHRGVRAGQGHRRRRPPGRAAAADGGPPPIAVVGSGLDVVYPRCNRGLWEEVAERGLLCAEVPPGTPPAAHRFPARNRILAALADVVVVVESRGAAAARCSPSPRRSRRGIPVMAVPGSVRSPASEGTNLLLVDGAAAGASTRSTCWWRSGLEARPARRRRPDRRPPPEPADRALLELFGTRRAHPGHGRAALRPAAARGRGGARPARGRRVAGPGRRLVRARRCRRRAMIGRYPRVGVVAPRRVRDVAHQRVGQHRRGLPARSRGLRGVGGASGRRRARRGRSAAAPALPGLPPHARVRAAQRRSQGLGAAALLRLAPPRRRHRGDPARALQRSERREPAAPGAERPGDRTCCSTSHRPGPRTIRSRSGSATTPCWRCSTAAGCGSASCAGWT